MRLGSTSHTAPRWIKKGQPGEQRGRATRRGEEELVPCARRRDVEGAAGGWRIGVLDRRRVWNEHEVELEPFDLVDDGDLRWASREESTVEHETSGDLRAKRLGHAARRQGRPADDGNRGPRIAPLQRGDVVAQTSREVTLAVERNGDGSERGRGLASGRDPGPAPREDPARDRRDRGRAAVPDLQLDGRVLGASELAHRGLPVEERGGRVGLLVHVAGDDERSAGREASTHERELEGCHLLSFG